MKINISTNSNKPIYRQIEEQIKEQILRGELKENEFIPSIRSLAKSLEISVITVKRAYTDLQSEGFIETIIGKGTFIKKVDKSELKNEVLKEIEIYLEKAVKLAQSSNISLNEIIKIIDKKFKK